MPIFLGAAQYACGTLIALENIITDSIRCTALRNAAEGVAFVPVWDGEILELAQIAVDRSLAVANRKACEIDAVFFVSNSLDAQDTLDSEWLGIFSEKFGLNQAAHYRIAMAGCAGFHWAAKLASALIATGECVNILMISFDQANPRLQRVYGEDSNFPYVTGDAASACVFSALSDRMSFRLMGRVVNIWDGKQARQSSLENEVGCIDRLFREVYAHAEINPDEVDLLITNNYSINVSRLYCQLASIDFKKAYTETIATHAHCFASDNVINLHHSQYDGSITPGARIMTFSAGPYQWGACIFEKLIAMKNRDANCS